MKRKTEEQEIPKKLPIINLKLEKKDKYEQKKAFIQIDIDKITEKYHKRIDEVLSNV